MAGQRYGTTSRVLHWLSALLVAVLLGLGLTMARFVESDLSLKFSLYQLHKSLGVTMLSLTVARLLWRTGHPPPPLPGTLASWEVRAGLANHRALYGLLIVMPLTGWALVSASTLAVETRLFGWIYLPHIPPLEALALETRQEIEPWLKWLHGMLAATIAVLAALHIAAALRHHFVLKDGVLARMWFSGGKPLAVIALAVLATAGAGFPATAADWTVDTARSVVAFEARAGGQTVKGRFERFAAAIAFDPNDPAAAKIAVDIDIASVSTGQAQIDEALRTEAWFDAARFPKARFRATGGTRSPDGRFALDGSLTLRGVAKPVELPFTLEMDGAKAHARAEVSIDRDAFGIGQDAIVRQLAVNKNVKISLDIHARASD